MIDIPIYEGEFWWCGEISNSHNFPFSDKSDIRIDINGIHECDQFAPLMLSSFGRYIWSEKPFAVTVKNGIMHFENNSEIILKSGYKNLKGAYLAAMNEHFPFSCDMPHKLFFEAPQYNTWMELGTDQTSEKIYSYAKGIIDRGLKAGILMIDGGWQEDYGIFEFNRFKIPDPKKLVAQLHDMGFKVMLWVSPIVSSAGTRYKLLRDKGYLIKTADGDIAIRKWWSGYSAVLDLTNPDSVAWIHSQLEYLMEEYGVDGFKFDAGDIYFYRDDDMLYEPMSAREHTSAYNKLGEKYQFNEFRAAYKYGGKPIVARLQDKHHSWTDYGLNTLIAHTVMQGLSGYAYACPDMVGGGRIGCLDNANTFDEELFVRWAQANALMCMMQISASPWRILSPENNKRVIDCINLHSNYSELFVKLGKLASKTGEPVIRHMAYEFPEEGFETVNDQFMVGSEILVAPVITKGVKSRKVKFPVGKWQSACGKIYEGNKTIDFDVTMDTLLYFTRIH